MRSDEARIEVNVPEEAVPGEQADPRLERPDAIVRRLFEIERRRREEDLVRMAREVLDRVFRDVRRQVLQNLDADDQVVVAFDFLRDRADPAIRPELVRNL